jgi:hypothetical protein
VTFWKVLYKRHTNFAMESIEVTFNGQADFNKRVTAVINRNADLMYRTYVQVVLPAVDLVNGGTNLRRFRWLNYIGHRLLKVIELEIGGQRIDRQYGDWLQIWTQLSQDAGTTEALDTATDVWDGAAMLMGVAKGSERHAMATLTITAGADDAALLRSLGDDLKFVTITSAVAVVDGAELAVSVAPSAAAKCDRCWHYANDIGQHAEHPALCGRCVSNLAEAAGAGNGETRKVA